MTTLHRPTTFADLIYVALRRYPDRTAFVHGSETWTYDQALDRILRLARLLRVRGIAPGQGVAVLAENRPDAWFAHAAALIADCRYTPLHPLGSLDDHAFVCEDADISLLVYDPRRFADRAGEIVGRLPDLPVLALGPSADAEDALALADRVDPAPPPTVGEDDLCWVVYTGGTTGRPKGAMLPHRCLVQNTLLTIADMQWPKDVRFLAATPISHSAGTFIVPTLLQGGTVAMIDHFDPELYCAVAAELKITATLLVPAAIYRLLERPSFNGRELPALESIFYGSSPMTPTRLLDGLERFGQIFNQLYGQAEAPNTITVLRKEDHDPARPERLASCGKPFVGVRVQVQTDDGAEAGMNEPGEICVRGPLVMNGYWKRPAETAEALRDDWLHTGDIGVIDKEGFITLVDRKNDMIISGGFNVYPREVEDALMAHADVALAAVIGVPDERWGEAVTAVVVAREGAELRVEELQALVRALKGPVYVPKAVHVVDSIPLTSVLKPDRKALRADFWKDESRAIG